MDLVLKFYLVQGLRHIIVHITLVDSFIKKIANLYAIVRRNTESLHMLSSIFSKEHCETTVDEFYHDSKVTQSTNLIQTSWILHEVIVCVHIAHIFAHVYSAFYKFISCVSLCMQHCNQDSITTNNAVIAGSLLFPLYNYVPY